MNFFHKTAETLRQGSKTLSQRYYVNDAILKKEMTNIFHGGWICCGRIQDIPNIGDFKLLNLDNESIIILRHDKNKFIAFYNICRHRGTRICIDECGNFSKTIQCPYHGWTYGLNGNLHVAPNMDAVEDFVKEDFSLHRVQLAEWNGFIFINLSESSSDFLFEFSSLIHLFDDWEMKNLLTLESKTYDVNCNWKLIIQNYSECYHCPLIHPSLAKITPYLGGRNDMVSGPFLGGFMEMKYDSITKNGNLCAPTLGKLSKEKLNRVYYYSIFPNLLLSLHPDYIMYHLVWPMGVNKCKISCSWLFSNKLLEESNHNPKNAIDFWDKTNLEDWKICEQSQLGINSTKYMPGPYSGQESLLAAYDEYYLRMLKEN